MIICQKGQQRNMIQRKTRRNGRPRPDDAILESISDGVFTSTWNGGSLRSTVRPRDHGDVERVTVGSAPRCSARTRPNARGKKIGKPVIVDRVSSSTRINPHPHQRIHGRSWDAAGRVRRRGTFRDLSEAEALRRDWGKRSATWSAAAPSCGGVQSSAIAASPSTVLTAKRGPARNGGGDDSPLSAKQGPSPVRRCPSDTLLESATRKIMGDRQARRFAMARGTSPRRDARWFALQVRLLRVLQERPTSRWATVRDGRADHVATNKIWRNKPARAHSGRTYYRVNRCESNCPAPQ
jgi:hypothetical protein